MIGGWWLVTGECGLAGAKRRLSYFTSHQPLVTIPGIARLYCALGVAISILTRRYHREDLPPFAVADSCLAARLTPRGAPYASPSRGASCG